MRNTHLLEQFMTENEIEFDVPFKVKFMDKKTKELTISKNIYDDSLMLTEDGEHIHSCECGKYIYNLLFSDNMKIIKKPWRPKGGEDYWHVSVNGNITQAKFDFSTICFANYVIGNVFRTREEALDHMNDVLKVLHGEPLIKWEE